MKKPLIQTLRDIMLYPDPDNMRFIVEWIEGDKNRKKYFKFRHEAVKFTEGLRDIQYFAGK